MSSKSVISREYKVMLLTGPFVGDESAVLQAAGKFWEAFTGVIEDVVLDTDGNLERIKRKRAISFFDTEDLCLRRSGYVFRRRAEIDTDGQEVESQVTLKFRHPDRYMSQDRNMDAADPDEDVDPKEIKTKLEEDIKAPFVSLFSHSTTQPINRQRELQQFGDVADLYTGIKNGVGCYHADSLIKKVADFTAKELVIAGSKDEDAQFKISRKPKENAECCLIIWYDPAISSTRPVVAEFSFRYGDKKEQYTAGMALRAHDAFRRLQKHLGGWVDPNSLTKTAYVFSRLGNISK